MPTRGLRLLKLLHLYGGGLLLAVGAVLFSLSLQSTGSVSGDGHAGGMGQFAGVMLVLCGLLSLSVAYGLAVLQRVMSAVGLTDHDGA
jgi:hypothetical protein